MQALDQLKQGEQLALAGEFADACFCLAWAMLSLRAAGRDVEAAEAALHLAWAQGLDGRTWQAARTLRDAIGGSGFARLTATFRARGHLLYAWALWDLGDYAGSHEQAEHALSTSDMPTDKARSLLNLGQIALHLGEEDSAESYFRQALHLDPALRATAFGVRAYQHNLAGRHRAALAAVEAGLEDMRNGSLENDDNTNRAVEKSALMVERATAKAFLGHSDARAILIEAQGLLDSLPFDTQLESARVKRATALVLAKAGEYHAALALLEEALTVFRRRSARPEYNLTARALNRLHKERSAKGDDEDST